jgi:hypothetical protein
VISRDLPAVSIVTPSYNQAEFLEATIRSVLGQDYPAIEYLVVDGGSTDGSQAIIRQYSSKLAWWVSEPDRGQADAIRKGFKQSSGDILAWLNSDDLYLPGAVSQAVAALQANPTLGMVYGDAITIDGDGKPLKRLAFPNWQAQDLIGFRIICQPAVFMKRGVYESVGGIDLDYHFMLDHHLWVRMASRAPVKHVPETWAAARHHGSAKNVAQATGFGRETLRMLAWIQSQPETRLLFERDRRKVLAGAYRLNARYLLDGGLPGEALKSYRRAFMAQPDYTLHHWHRIAYAMVWSIGGKELADRFVRVREKPAPRLENSDSLVGWPGLSLEELR